MSDCIISTEGGNRSRLRTELAGQSGQSPQFHMASTAPGERGSVTEAEPPRNYEVEAPPNAIMPKTPHSGRDARHGGSPGEDRDLTTGGSPPLPTLLLPRPRSGGATHLIPQVSPTHPTTRSTCKSPYLTLYRGHRHSQPEPVGESSSVSGVGASRPQLSRLEAS